MHDMVSDREWARSFYTSRKWIKCRRGFARSKDYLCERCLAKGLITPCEEVHHKIRLTPDNINDPDIALGWSNLEALCKECHLEEHRHAERRWSGITDADGRVTL